MERIPYKKLGMLVDKAVAAYIDKHFADVKDVQYGQPVVLTPKQEQLAESLAIGWLISLDVCKPIMPKPTSDTIQCLQFNRRSHGND